jgi:hypothetical protein
VAVRSARTATDRARGGISWHYDESCQGFIDDHRPGKPWAVHFAPQPSPPTPQGYTSLEFLAWLCCHIARDRGFDVGIRVNAPPPYINGPSTCMNYALSKVGTDTRTSSRRLYATPVITSSVCRMEETMQHSPPGRYRKDDPNRKFVQSRLWREKLRPLQLARFPLCEHCKALGIVKAAYRRIMSAFGP